MTMGDQALHSTATIRPFEPDDFTAIEAIYAHSKLDELRFEQGVFELVPLQEDEPRFRGLMAARIVVSGQSDVQGFGAVFGNEIRAIFVHPSYRGTGIGKALLQYLISMAEKPVRLSVAKSNAPAVELYRRHGFVTVREFEAHYNGVPVRAIEMERSQRAFKGSIIKGQ